MTRLVEDRALLDAFRRGERPALTEVYREYARPLFALLLQGFVFDSQGRRVAFSGVREGAELEPLVQEVFTRAFAERARLAYDGLRPYRNYLFTIARNLVADSYRQAHKRFVPLDEVMTAVSETDPWAPPPVTRPADEQRHDDQLAAHLKTFIEALQPGERAIFETRFEEGASVEEASRRLGVSEHEVKATQQHLRKRFFVAMRRHGYFEGYEWRGVGVAKTHAFLVFALGGVAWRS